VKEIELIERKKIYENMNEHKKKNELEEKSDCQVIEKKTKKINILTSSFSIGTLKLPLFPPQYLLKLWVE
jgi:hypothetical protein